MTEPATPAAQRQWRVAPQNGGDPSELDWLGDAAPLAAHLLHSRGLRGEEQVRAFLEPAPRNLKAPKALGKQLESAAQRLAKAIRERTTVGVYGDFDVDGLSAAAIVADAVRAAGGQCEVYIPDREEEGHGVSAAGIKALLAAGARLIVTVDTGINSHAELALAQEAGAEVIVTDHHKPDAGRLPNVAALVSGGAGGLTPALCGAGTAFMLAQAAFATLGLQQPPHWWALACLGTVADCVPLEGDNRIIARMGLQELATTAHAGLRALVESVRFAKRGSGMTAETISFHLAPRLNAPSRLGDPSPSLHILSASSVEAAKQLAAELESKNRKRKTLTAKAERELEQQMAEQPYRNLIACQVPHEFIGMSGLLAGRIAGREERPAVIYAQLEDRSLRASVRGAGVLDVHAALLNLSEHLVKFGGHAQAGGFTVLPQQLDTVLQALDMAVAWQGAGSEDTDGGWDADCELPLSELKRAHWNFVALMEPFGTGNPAPRLLARGVRVSGVRAQGRQRRVQAALSDGGPAQGAFAYGLELEDGEVYDIVYGLEIDKWRGRIEYLVRLEEARPAD